MTKVAASLTANPLLGFSPNTSYWDNLHLTRAIVGDYLTPSEGRYWFNNEELTWDVSLVPRKSGTPYDGEVNPGDAFYGEYGGASYEDVFSDAEQPSLYLQQGKQATDGAYFFLRQMSKTLPPRISLLKIADDASGIVNGQTGTPISFALSENRTEYVDVDIYVQDTGQRIVTEGGQALLDGSLSQSGITQMRNLGGPLTWVSQPIQLYGTKNDSSLLPYQAQITAFWKGRVASGDPLSEGQHTLCVAVRDRDWNGPSHDTCTEVVLDTKPPRLTLMDSSKTLLDKVEGVHSITVDDGSLKLTADDLTSGIRKVTFARTDLPDSPPTVVEYDTPRSSLDQMSFGPLVNGSYKLEVLDAARNATSVNIEVNLQPVGISVDSDFRTGIIDTRHEIVDAATLSTTLTIKAYSSGNALAQVRMFNGESEVFNETNFGEPHYFTKAASDLLPGDYTITTKDVEDHSIQATLTVGSYSVEISTTQSTSSYREASNDSAANIHAKFQTSLGLEAIELHRGAPDFSVLRTIPQSGQNTPAEVDFTSLLSGQYYAVGKAKNGETFGLGVGLADSTFMVLMAVNDSSASFTNTEVVDGMLHLTKQQTRFSESGTYTSVAKEIVDVVGRKFLGGALTIKYPGDGCAGDMGGLEPFYPDLWGRPWKPVTQVATSLLHEPPYFCRKPENSISEEIARLKL